MAQESPTVQRTPEEEGWVRTADAADDGKGISLADVDLNDMQEVYEALNVTGLAKTRLRTLIRKLQQQQQPQPNDQITASIWEHLNVSLPTMPYDDDDVLSQKKSTTEFAAHSSTPCSVVFWDNFDQLVIEAQTKPENCKVVDHNIKALFDRVCSGQNGTGVISVVEEEDVTQNTVRILDLQLVCWAHVALQGTNM